MKTSLLIWLPLALFLLSGCGVVRTSTSGNTDTGDRIQRSQVSQKLQAAYNEWVGTPYLLGGQSKSGIDCSAFTQIVLREYFGRQIPRHTRDQLQEGRGVRRNSEQPGDLIFFRTAGGVLHVGIAMGRGDFLHASVSSGVMISNTGEQYWSARYLGTRRVL